MHKAIKNLPKPLPSKFFDKPLSIEELDKVRWIVDALNTLHSNKCLIADRDGIISQLIVENFADQLRTFVKDAKTKIYLLHTTITLNEPRLIDKILPFLGTEYTLEKVQDAGFSKKDHTTLVRAVLNTRHIMAINQLHPSIREGQKAKEAQATTLSVIPFAARSTTDAHIVITSPDFKKIVDDAIFSRDPIRMKQSLNEENLKGYFAALNRSHAKVSKEKKISAINCIVNFGDVSTKEILAHIAEEDKTIKKTLTAHVNAIEAALDAMKSVYKTYNDCSKNSFRRPSKLSTQLYTHRDFLGKVNFAKKIILAPPTKQKVLLAKVLGLYQKEERLVKMLAEALLPCLKCLLKENDGSFEEIIELILTKPHMPVVLQLTHVINESGQTCIDIYLQRAKTESDDAFKAAINKIMSSRWVIIQHYVIKTGLVTMDHLPILQSTATSSAEQNNTEGAMASMTSSVYERLMQKAHVKPQDLLWGSDTIGKQLSSHVGEKAKSTQVSETSSTFSKRRRDDAEKARAMPHPKRPRHKVSGGAEDFSENSNITPGLLIDDDGVGVPVLDIVGASSAILTNSMGHDTHPASGAYTFFDPWDAALDIGRHDDIIPGLLSDDDSAVDDGAGVPVSATAGCGVSSTNSMGYATHPASEAHAFWGENDWDTNMHTPGASLWGADDLGLGANTHTLGASLWAADDLETGTHIPDANSRHG